jgi:carbamate kinase
MKKIAVVALGGNALLRENEIGTIEQQEANTTETLENLIFLLNEGFELVITHGNGPQVGNILMRNAAGNQLYDIAPMPLDICVADSQGGIGYMIERMIRNVLKKHGINKNVITLVSMTIVDPADPAFGNPTKGIGKIYTEEEAKKLQDEKGWIFKPSAKAHGGWRRMVSSPQPIDIINQRIIKDLVRAGNIVIAASSRTTRSRITARSAATPSIRSCGRTCSSAGST